MKRLIVIILSFLYLISAVGITIQVHFCMGKIAEVSFLHCDKDICTKCGMKKAEKGNGCCKDEFITFKVDDHQQVKKTVEHAPKQIITLLPAYLLHSALSISHSFITHTPPLFRRQSPTYIQLCSLRI